MADKPVMVITGASTGVGRASALRFAEDGYLVCALARSADKLASLEAAKPGEIFAYVCDVSDNQQVDATFTTIITNMAKLTYWSTMPG